VVDTPDGLKRGLDIDGLLEIDIDFSAGQEADQAAVRLLDCLRPRFQGAQLAGGLLTLHGPDLAARLPEALAFIEAAGGQAGSVHMRAVTLEDVFLSLTGRGLRE
jgi:ABC-2 type transport system ATP-binding protein